jgi:hypothetical protein
MNWKNLTLDGGFIRQDIKISGTTTINYIPLAQVDSFGVVNTENKFWLYIGIFIGVLAVISTTSSRSDIGATLGLGFLATVFVAIYFLTRKIKFNVTSNQVKFSVLVATSKQELEAVNIFVDNIKKQIVTQQLINGQERMTAG